MPKPFQACGLHLYTHFVATYEVTLSNPYSDEHVLTMSTQTVKLLLVAKELICDPNK